MYHFYILMLLGMLEREVAVDIPDIFARRWLTAGFQCTFFPLGTAPLILPITSNWKSAVCYLRHYTSGVISQPPFSQTTNGRSGQVCCTIWGYCFVEDRLGRRQWIIPVEYRILCKLGLVLERGRFWWGHWVAWLRSCWITKRYHKMRWGWNARQLLCSEFTGAAYLRVLWR